MLLQIGYGLLVSILHFFSDAISLRLISVKERLLSFGAGVSIAYLFVELLPLVSSVPDLRDFTYIFILAGFAIFHLVEKYIYQHAKKKQLIKQLKEAHSGAFFVYYFVVGIILYYLTTQNPAAGTLFLVPVLFHASISSASAQELHTEIKEKLGWRLAVASSTLLGVLSFYFFNIPLNVVFSLLGFVIGALFYIIIKDILPEEKEGSPSYFVLGLALFIMLLYVVRQFL